MPNLLDCYDFGVDYKSSFGAGNLDGRWTSPHNKTSSAQECVDLCKFRSADGCTHMTWISTKGDCWLRTDANTVAQVEAAISAPMDCESSGVV